MSSVLFPTRVTPAPCAVPRFTVTYSRTVVPSPISTQVSSPLNFRSCGGAPIDANEDTRFLFPMRTCEAIWTWELIEHPSPIVTFGPITV